MIDKNGKIFSKISVIDIIIVLALALCIAAAFIRFSGLLGDNTTASTQFEYVVKISKVRENTAGAALKKGGMYSSLSDGTYMGEVVSVEKKPHEGSAPLVDGTVVKSSAEERFDVYMTVRTNGKKTETALYSEGGKLIKAGATEFVATKWLAGEAEIISVNIIE